MGTSTNAVLCYGIDLGGYDEFLVEQTGEYGGLEVAWYDDEEGDFATQATDRILAAHGFTETDWRVDGYYDRKHAAEEAIGVEIESHCSGEYPMFILAAHVITARRGYVETLDLAALNVHPDRPRWDERLRWAVEALAITPKQQAPAWLLCSYWG